MHWLVSIFMAPLVLWKPTVLAVSVIAIGGVAGNLVYDLLKATTGLEKSVWLTLFFSIVIIAILSVILPWTINSLGFTGIRAGRMTRDTETQPVDVLVLAVSKRDDDDPPHRGLDLGKQLEIVERFILKASSDVLLEARGSDGKRVSFKGPDAWTIDHLCIANAVLVDTLRQTSAEESEVRLKDLPWPQAWRSLRSQIQRDDSRLDIIELIVTRDFQDSANAVRLEMYKRILETLIKRTSPSRTIKVQHTTGYCDAVSFENYQTSLGSIIEKTLTANPWAQIGIDITGGIRNYAISGAVAALHPQAHLLYVSAAADGTEQETLCFKVLAIDALTLRK